MKILKLRIVTSKSNTFLCHASLFLHAETYQSIYPTIDPKAQYDAQTFSGKVVLITGASRGIGEEIAMQYTRAGANLTLVARSKAGLDATRDAVLRECPSAQVLVFPAEVQIVAKAEEAVATTVRHFGHLDILVANAGSLRQMDQRALSLLIVLGTFKLICPVLSFCEVMVGCSRGQYSWPI